MRFNGGRGKGFEVKDEGEMVSTYQSPAADKDHEDNESFKPVVLHYLIARFSHIPPEFTFAFFYAYLTALELAHTV